MEKSRIFGWLADAGVLPVTLALLVSMLAAFALGHWLRRRSVQQGKTTSLEQSQEGLIVSGVMVVVGLLIGFTFSLALDRFEQRRLLVVTEANAIGTSYLRAQLLDEPDRSRLSRLLTAYTDNRIALGSATVNKQRLIEKNDRLLTQIWAAVSSAVETPKGRTISTPLLLAFNELIDHDTLRKSARVTRLPGMVMMMLYIFLVVTAAVVGFVLSGRRQQTIAVIMFVLLTLAISIIVDLNRPTSGTIMESQEPMLLTRKLLAQPSSDFDQYKQAQPTNGPR